MKGILDLANVKNIPTQVSMERWMKCAIGVCGQCCVDDSGWRICKEGPVFWAEDLNHIKEFGKYRRDSSGTRHNY
jgi:dihydroorotate dehydrogenase electron transfer subunit